MYPHRVRVLCWADAAEAQGHQRQARCQSEQGPGEGLDALRPDGVEEFPQVPRVAATFGAEAAARAGAAPAAAAPAGKPARPEEPPGQRARLR